jgi:hypothetical protein
MTLIYTWLTMLVSAASEQGGQSDRPSATPSQDAGLASINANNSANGNHAAYLSGPSSSIRAFPTVQGPHGTANPAYINLNPVDNVGSEAGNGSPFLGNEAALQLDLNSGDGSGVPESMALHQVCD